MEVETSAYSQIKYLKATFSAVYPNGVADYYGYTVPSLMEARPFETMTKVTEHIKLPLDNTLVAVYNKGASYGYIPFEFTQVMDASFSLLRLL